MTPREIIKTVQGLPPAKRRKVINALQLETDPSVLPISEEEVNRKLYERGVIGTVPNAADYTDEDDDFQAVRIKGKPLSKTVVEERR